MPTQSTALGKIGFSTVFLLASCWLWSSGCETNNNARAGWDGPLVVNPLGGFTGVNIGGAAPRGGSPANGGSSSVPCSSPAEGEHTHSAGNYDNLSCNKADCHADTVGGWVYASARGYPWVEGATVTVTNTDGTKIEVVSGSDGFFDFGHMPHLTSPYTVCVSKCPNTDCNVTTHTSSDCLSSNCHAQPNLRIYVTTSFPGTGGASGGQNCRPPTPGGPYVHLETIYSATNMQPCAGCHFDPAYVGGYLYEGPEASNNKVVAEATMVLTPQSGSPVTAVSGPDGMLFFGENAINTKAYTIPTPYTACVSKCPTSEICSITNGHLTPDDCGTCHNGSTTGKMYLR